MSNITIVIPVKNDAKYLESLLPTLDTNMDIIFFMDSTDNSKDLIEAYNTPNWQIIISTMNKAQIYNHVMKIVTSPYLLLLQPFIELQQDTIQILLDTIQLDTNISSVAPLILDKRGLCSGAGIVFSRSQIKEADRGKLSDEPRLTKQMQFKALRDSCLLIRRINLFRVTYKDSHQDIDWTLSANLAGYKNIYEPKAKVTSNFVPAFDPYHDTNNNTFIFYTGGIDELDKLNNCGTYYGSGMNYPTIETWVRNTGDVKARIVCFLADWEGCGNYRILNPYRMLVIDGFEVMFTMYLVDEFIEWADVCVMQRQCSKHSLDGAKKIRSLGKPLIYEIDDFFHGLHIRNPVTPYFYNNPHELRYMEEIIYLADALTVSTRELAKQYGRFNTNTHVIPNHIDLGMIPKDINVGDGKQIRIGWGGSSTHDTDIPYMISALERILHEYPQTQMVFLGADYRYMLSDVDPQRLEWIPSTFEHEEPVSDYYKILNQACLDIGLAPLENTLFNSAKSSVKILEYSSLGIVPICSDVEPYTLFAQDARKDGQKAVLLCRSEQDWYKNMKSMILDADARFKIASRAQRYVWENLGIDKMSMMLEQVLLGILAGYGHKPKSTEVINPDGTEVLSYHAPVHSLNVPYLNNLTSKQIMDRRIAR